MNELTSDEIKAINNFFNLSSVDKCVDNNKCDKIPKKLGYCYKHFNKDVINNICQKMHDTIQIHKLNVNVKKYICEKYITICKEKMEITNNIKKYKSMIHDAIINNDINFDKQGWLKYSKYSIRSKIYDFDVDDTYFNYYSVLGFIKLTEIKNSTANNCHNDEYNKKLKKYNINIEEDQNNEFKLLKMIEKMNLDVELMKCDSLIKNYNFITSKISCMVDINLKVINPTCAINNNVKAITYLINNCKNILMLEDEYSIKMFNKDNVNCDIYMMIKTKNGFIMEMIIEIDGDGHLCKQYKYVERDIYRDMYCFKNGISMIRYYCKCNSFENTDGKYLLGFINNLIKNETPVYYFYDKYLQHKDKRRIDKLKNNIEDGQSKINEMLKNNT